MAEIMGSEFIVEMVAGQKMTRGDKVCTLEYVAGSDIDDEAAYRMEDHPGGMECGVCVRGGQRGRTVLVEFSTELTAGESILLHMAKQRMFQRWLVEKYGTAKPTEPSRPETGEE